MSAPLLGAFLGLTYLVLTGRTEAFDQAATAAARAQAQDHGWLLLLMRAVTPLGNVTALVLLGAVVVVTLLARGPRELAVVWVAAGVGGGWVNSSLKELCGRERPALALRDAAAPETNPSYPSGHSQASLENFGLLGYVYWRWSRRRGLVLALLAFLVLLIGASRVYLGAHWCSDVLGGYLVGGAWLALWVAVAEWWRKSHAGLAVRQTLGP